MYTKNQTNSFNFKVMGAAFMAVAVLFCFGRFTNDVFAKKNTETGHNTYWLLQLNIDNSV